MDKQAIPDQTDDDGNTPYQLDGYTWELKQGHEIGPGTLIPGHVGEVYEIQSEAGYSFGLDERNLVSVMIDDGDISHLPEWRRTNNREDFNDALTERVNVHRFEDDKEYWVVIRED